MTENSVVKEHQCEERRGDVYTEVKTLRTDIDKMKGGISVFKFVLPTMIVLLGAWVTLLFMWIKSEVKNQSTTSTVKAQSVEWNEKTERLEAVDTP